MPVSELACDPAEDFARHQSWLRTVVLARLGNREEADEVLQEVALAAANQAARRQRIDRTAPWLYRVALRQVLLLRRRQGRRRRLMTNLVSSLPPTDVCTKNGSPLEWMLSEERGQLVQQALSALGERDRQLLLLKYVEGLSYEAIGQTLGVTASAVQSRLHRARRQLRARLIQTQDSDRCLNSE